MKNDTNRYLATRENVPLMIKPILDALESIKASGKDIYKINLVLEELLVNVANYAYYPNQGEVEVSYLIDDDPIMITITISDEGKEFNPLEKEEPDITLPSKERQIGGLGLFLVKNIMDEINYFRKEDKNILIIKKNIRLEN